jgi:hypothetical protein
MGNSRKPKQHDDDEEETEEETTLTLGTGDPAQGNDSEAPIAVLWVPDPEQRHRWREYYVRKPDKKEDRPFGFRKPGAK